MAEKTRADLTKQVRMLKEKNDDLTVQLDAVTDKLQDLESGVIAQPDGGLGGPALLPAYCLYLATLDPGLTVGEEYDFELNLTAAKHFWIEQGGEAEDLD